MEAPSMDAQTTLKTETDGGMLAHFACALKCHEIKLFLHEFLPHFLKEIYIYFVAMKQIFEM
jgi:hypothetical protein